MSFELKPISEQQFDAFYESYEREKTFLQTSKYGTYRKKLGEETFLMGLFEDEELVGIALIQKIPAKRGVHLHIPHFINEQLTENNEQLLGHFLEAYIEMGKREQCDFVRIAPLIPIFSPLTTFQSSGFRPAPVHLVNPEKTWVLDLNASEEELLKNMRKSTRYEINRIEKVGIAVRMGNSREDLDIFWRLHEETVKRQGFVPFSRRSTEIELETWGEDCQIFSAAVEGEYLSSSVILFDSHAAYYHQGASSYSKLPVAHATLWAAILEAKKRGCTEFNFWGVCGEEQTKHPWYGLSRFKRGFGGVEKNFLHAQDYPLTKKYWVNWGVEKWRKWRRGY